MVSGVKSVKMIEKLRIIDKGTPTNLLNVFHLNFSLRAGTHHTFVITGSCS